MGLIGLEINDAGLMAAGGQPPGLLALDDGVRESPGFALPQKKGVLVGKAAERQAHIFPRLIQHNFWDQLTTDPLPQTGKYIPRNHAEIVYHHLSLIWQQLQSHGNEIVMAVPSFYKREQLGLILGIAHELGLPLKGFAPLPLAASFYIRPQKMLLYLDIDLHRIEVSYLEQGEHLIVRDSATTSEKGLLRLYRKMADTIGQEFVRTTRFDPFHQAASEQELYDRLPEILSHFQHNSSMMLELTAGGAPYSITLKRETLRHQAESVFSEIIRLIKRMQAKRGKDQPSLVLQVSHRLCRLPGCKEMLATIKNAQIVKLDRGAAARGLQMIWPQLTAQSDNQGISFFTSRPWQRQPSDAAYRPAPKAEASAGPTHLLYRNIAYPISETPLTVGGLDDNAITVETNGVSPKHCIITLQDGEIILKNLSEEGTFIDEQRVNGTITLKLGQVIRVGTPGDQLQLIKCLN